MSAGTPYIGSKISLISKAEIRYEGTLYAVDTKESTVTLQKVKSFGTENRPVPKHVPPRSEVYEYIIFRGSDIKDLHVSEVSKQEEQPPDPAILSRSAPVAMQTGTAPNPSVLQQSQPLPQQQPSPSGPLTHPPFPPAPMGAYNPFAMPYFSRPPPMMGPLPPPQQMLPPHMLHRPPPQPPSGGMIPNRYLPSPAQYPAHFMMHSHPHMVPWQHHQPPQPLQGSEEDGLLPPWQPPMGMEPPPVQLISSQPLLQTHRHLQQDELGVEEEEEEMVMTAAQPDLVGGERGGVGGWGLLLPQHLMPTTTNEPPAQEEEEEEGGAPLQPTSAWRQPLAASNRGDFPFHSVPPSSQGGSQSRQQLDASVKEPPSQAPPTQAPNGGKQQAPPTQTPNGGKQQAPPTQTPTQAPNGGKQQAPPTQAPTQAPNGGKQQAPPTQTPNGGKQQAPPTQAPTQAPNGGKQQAPPTQVPNEGKQQAPPNGGKQQTPTTQAPNGGKQQAPPTQAPNEEKQQAPPTQAPNGGKQQGPIPSGSSAPPVMVVGPSATATSLSWPQHSKPSPQGGGISTSATSTSNAFLPPVAVMTMPRPAEPTSATRPASTSKRPGAKGEEAKQDPHHQRGSKMPLSPKLAGTDQVQVSGNSAEPVPNGKAAKLAEGKVEPQRPLSASRRWHQGEQRHVAQPTAHATEGRGGQRRENYPPKGAARNDGQPQQQRAFRYDMEFDFESANARFDKENLEEEFKHKVKIVDGGGKAVDPEECEEGELEQDEGGEEDGEEMEPHSEVTYDKSKSFFDNITCDGNKTGGNSYAGRHEERALNTETFGVSTVHGYRYGSRGGRGRMRGGGGGYYRSRGRRGGSGHPRQAVSQDRETSDGGVSNGYGGGGGGGGGGGHYRYGRERQNHFREYRQDQRRLNNREQQQQQQSQPQQLEKN